MATQQALLDVKPFSIAADVFKEKNFFFHCIISEVAWPIVSKVCHMFDSDPDLET